MAAAKSKRQSRKRRRSAGGVGRSPVQAAPAPRAPARELKAERRVAGDRQQRQANRMLGAVGERPESPFGGFPVSEIAIFAGGVGVIYGLLSGAAPALVVGIAVCTLGVIEFTAREHFSGYRSHASLLAAIPAIGAGIAMIALLGGSSSRGLLLLVVVPVFLVCFWLLRRRFLVARQARIARPPAP